MSDHLGRHWLAFVRYALPIAKSRGWVALAEDAEPANPSP